MYDKYIGTLRLKARWDFVLVNKVSNFEKAKNEETKNEEEISNQV